MVPPHGSAQGAGEPTVTVTDRSGEVPPGPVHWKVYVASAVSGSVSPLPERVPELDHGPPAVQLVASLEPQVSVERPSYAIGLGEAVRVALGTLEMVSARHTPQLLPAFDSVMDPPHEVLKLAQALTL